MARTTEELLRDYIGNQVMALISLTAEVERLREEIIKLDNARDPLIGKPNGKEYVPPAGSVRP